MGVSALCIPGLALFAIGCLKVRKGAVQRALEAAPMGGIDVSVDRYVKLAGSAQSPAGLGIREPHLNQPCVWFSIRLHKYRPLTEAHRAFRYIASKRSVAPFQLVNESGAVLIRPERARMCVPFKDEHWEGRYRAKMACVYPGDRLFAVGDVQRLDPPVDGADFELVGTREAPLIVSTLTEDEILSDTARTRGWGVALIVIGSGVLLISLLI